MFTVEIIRSAVVKGVRYAAVRRNGEIICDAIILEDGRTVTDIEFAYDKYRLCNRTRQAAMRALQKAGYR